MRGERLLSLLALLIIDANRVVSPDRLIDEIWHGQQPSGAPKVLQNLVHRLRAAFRSDAGDEHLSSRIQTVAGGYVLRVEPGELDSERFEASLIEARRALDDADPRRAADGLRGALAVWRGRPFQQVAFEDFARGEITRLEELHCTASEDLIEAQLALGDGEQVVPQLKQLVMLHPTRERLHGQLMRALYAEGRQSEALDAYATCRQILKYDAGLDPGPELQRIHRAVLDHALPVVDRDRRPATDMPSSRPERPSRLVWGLGGLVAALAIGTVVVALRESPPRPDELAADIVASFDPVTGEVDAIHTVGETPRAVVADGTAVWVASFGAGTTTRLDSRTGEAASRGSDGVVTALAAGSEGVWSISSFTGRVERLQSEPGSARASVQLPPGLADVQTAHGSVWVSNTQEGTLTKIDPNSATIKTVIEGLGGPSGLASDGDHVWLADTFGKRLLGIDPSTGGIDQEIGLSLAPSAIAHAAGVIWATHPLDDVVTRFDLGTRESTLIPVGRGPTHLAADETAAWVVNDLDHTVTRIDTQTGTISTTIEFNSDGEDIRTVISPAGVDIGPDRVWITVQAIYPEPEGAD